MRKWQKISQQPKNKAVMYETSAITKQLLEKLSKDPNTRVATSQKRQAKPNRKSSKALTSEVTSVVGPLQIPPKRKTKGETTPHPDRQKHGTKQEKNIQLKNENYPKKRQIWAHGNRGFHLPNWENTDEHKNEKPGSTFKMPLRTVIYKNQTVQYSGINKTPIKNL